MPGKLTLAHFLLRVVLPRKYPEVVPEIFVSEAATTPKITIARFDELIAQLNSIAGSESNLGTAMVFMLADSLKIMLEKSLVWQETKKKGVTNFARCKSSKELEEEMQRKNVEEQLEEQRQRLQQEAEKCEEETGCRPRMTFEEFLQWKKKVRETKLEEKEQNAKKLKKEKVRRGWNQQKEEREAQRMTGKEFFQRGNAEGTNGFEEGEEDGLLTGVQEINMIKENSIAKGAPHRNEPSSSP